MEPSYFDKRPAKRKPLTLDGINANQTFLGIMLGIVVLALIALAATASTQQSLIDKQAAQIQQQSEALETLLDTALTLQRLSAHTQTIIGTHTNTLSQHAGSIQTIEAVLGTRARPAPEESLHAAEKN